LETNKKFFSADAIFHILKMLRNCTIRLNNPSIHEILFHVPCPTQQRLVLFSIP
jgi:hypothetical protein